MSHTPEPWLAIDCRILPVNYVLTGAPIATVHARKKHEMQTDNAKRIVACVNACKGSSTEWLEFQTSADRVEQFGPPEPFETRYTKELQKGLEYMEQRDSLLAALRSAKHMLTRDYIDDAKMAVIEKCDTAITEVTGVEEL